MVFSLIAIRGRGYYALYADEGGEGVPFLHPITDPDIIASYREMFSVALVEAHEAQGGRPTEILRPLPAAGQAPSVVADAEEQPRACDAPCPVRIVDEAYVRRRTEGRPTPPGFQACVVVAGSVVPMLKGVPLRAVEALITAFPDGYSADDLNDAARAGDARNALKDLAARNPIWNAALRFPRSKGGQSGQNLGYRLATYTEIVESMAELFAAGTLGREAFRRALHECGPDAPPPHLEHLLSLALGEEGPPLRACV
jgi:hypothetical protein